MMEYVKEKGINTFEPFILFEQMEKGMVVGLHGTVDHFVKMLVHGMLHSPELKRAVRRALITSTIIGDEVDTSMAKIENLKTEKDEQN